MSSLCSCIIIIIAFSLTDVFLMQLYYYCLLFGRCLPYTVVLLLPSLLQMSSLCSCIIIALSLADVFLMQLYYYCLLFGRCLPYAVVLLLPSLWQMSSLYSCIIIAFSLADVFLMQVYYYCLLFGRCLPYAGVLLFYYNLSFSEIDILFQYLKKDSITVCTFLDALIVLRVNNSCNFHMCPKIDTVHAHAFSCWNCPL